MPTLNDLLKQFHEIEDAIYDNGGELTPEIEALFEENAEDLNAKLDRMAGYINYAKTQKNGLKERIGELQARIKTTDNTIERLRNMILFAMQSKREDKIRTAEHTFFISNRPKVTVDLEAIPDDILMELKDKGYLTLERKFDKNAIKKDYAGEDFVTSEENETIGIR